MAIWKKFVITVFAFSLLICLAISQEPKSCTPCSPGMAVARLCLNDSDTLCAVCPSKTFNPVQTLNTHCTPCTECLDGWYEMTPCNPMKDAVCVTCSETKLKMQGGGGGSEGGGGFGNEDFLRKCERTTTTSTTTTTTTTIIPNTEKTVNVGNTSFVTEVGSGEESSGEEVVELTTEDLITPNSIDTIPNNTSTDIPTLPTALVEVRVAEVTEGQFKHWWIILLILLALLACFAVGAVYRHFRNKRSSPILTEKPKMPSSSAVIEMDDSSTREPLTNGSRTSSVTLEPCEDTPMFNGNKTT